MISAETVKQEVKHGSKRIPKEERKMKLIKNTGARNAVFIGSLCSVSYLAVYIARNILGAVTPQMIADGGYTTEFIGTVSSVYFTFYAVGQLINGAIGDKVKARYMISCGLVLAGICNFIFPQLSSYPFGAQIIYGMTGFFLSMIYAPMTKVVSENTELVYAVRCSLGYTFASFFGSPLAGVLAALLAWQRVFQVSSIVLLGMGVVCFLLFLCMEKRGIVKYNQYSRKREENKGAGIRALIQHGILRFTLISIITGVVRTTVVFWLPTYLAQQLGFAAEVSASIFTVATFVISMTVFVAIFLYERLHQNMNLTIFVSFLSAVIFFLLVYMIRQPVWNIVFLILAIMSSNCAASMLWSRYCPSLRDTGMVSSATGFLDFVSYMAAAASSTIFANAVSVIGWGNLILVWAGLMVVGVLVTVPVRNILPGSRSTEP